jgi:hypothetical protein
MTSTAYRLAVAAVKIAAQQYAEAVRAYRAGEISDAAYAEARRDHDYAEADFDEAYVCEFGTSAA